jgi:Pyridoxamine 5'-phosphate oxidase
VATAISEKEIGVRPASEALTSPVGGDVGKVMGSRLTNEQVWQAIAGAAFAVIGYVTPAGEPRSSGVVYKTVGSRLYLAVAPDSWKAKHISARGEVSVTVPVRRGGVLSLLLPIPPATVSFHASAKVHPAGSPEARSALKALAPLLPAERKDTGSIIEVIPEGAFLTYGLGVSLSEMRNPAAARGRVPAR